MRQRALVNALGLAHRVGRNRHGFTGTTGDRRDFLPQFFGHKRNDRVRQAQDGFQRANQGAPGGALLGQTDLNIGVVSALLDLYLGNFQIPVAELVPDKVINRAGDVVQPVFFKAFGDVGFGALQQRDDPAVGRAEIQVALRGTADGTFFLRVLVQAAILAFAIHQHKAAGVPQFVAKVAVAFTAFGIEIDAAAQRGERGEGEAQGVCAEGRDAGGEFLFGILAHGRCGFGFAQSL